MRYLVGIALAVTGIASLGGSVALSQAASPPPKTSGAASELPGPDPLLRELIGFKVRYRDLLKRNIMLVRTVTVSYTAWNGARRQAVLVLPKWYGPKIASADPARDLAPRARRDRTARRTRSSGAACPRSAPSRSSTRRGRAGSSPPTPGAGAARSTTSHGCRPSSRPALPWLHIDHDRDLRDREQHGRPGDAAPRRAAPQAAHRRRTARLSNRHGRPISAFPALPDGPPLQQRARIEIGGTPPPTEGLRRPEPDLLHPPARQQRCPARHLVEPQGQDRRQPAPGIRTALPSDQASQPESTRRAVRRHLGTQPRDAPTRPPSARPRRPQDRRARRATRQDPQALTPYVLEPQRTTPCSSRPM